MDMQNGANHVRMPFHRNRYGVYGVRGISWLVVALYAYLGFSNPGFFSRYSVLSLVFLLAVYASDYQVGYAQMSFGKRLVRVLLHLALVALVVFAMYLLATL